jgi:hypothetical protein
MVTARTALAYNGGLEAEPQWSKVAKAVVGGRGTYVHPFFEDIIFAFFGRLNCN